MPLWISASQPSVMENTLYFDNGKRFGTLLVSGIISPAQGPNSILLFESGDYPDSCGSERVSRLLRRQGYKSTG